jgi:putative YhdH/YhfP family quinone oxidoreductase
MPFKALWITETAEGKFERNIVERMIDDLPSGEVVIRVHYSALNYKDALSATGNKGITRKFPHTPGIDAAGTVEISRSELFTVGEEVIVTGYDLGMNTCGGFGEYIRVPAGWVVRKPDGYTLRECMILGTAGFTAASALFKMELMGQHPQQGPVVVTGSTGGVGSMAVAILNKAGYEVIAITGKPIQSREWVYDTTGKALLRAQWAGAIDTVGGNTLATLLKACQIEGNVVSTGLVGSSQLATTVYPFILNGVSLLGVGSAETPMIRRMAIWDRLSTSWNIKEKLNSIAKEVSLEDLNDIYIDSILEGKVMGRIVVKMSDK